MLTMEALTCQSVLTNQKQALMLRIKREAPQESKTLQHVNALFTIHRHRHHKVLTALANVHRHQKCLVSSCNLNPSYCCCVLNGPAYFRPINVMLSLFISVNVSTVFISCLHFVLSLLFSLLCYVQLCTILKMKKMLISFTIIIGTLWF